MTFPRPTLRALFPIAAAALSILTVGCPNKPPQPPPGQCGGEQRVPLSCESEFKYDALNIKGGFQALGVGTNLATETQALRQIDAETERYAAQSKRLCEEYNACILDKETYATRAENLRRRMAKVPELYDQVKSASDSDRAKALGVAYQVLVPDDQRTELQMDFSVMAMKPDQTQARPIKPGEVLRTNSRVAFVVRTSKAAHVYIFQRSPDGAVNVLFPDDRIGLANPLPAGQALRIPSGDRYYRVNEKDIGEEKVFLVASLQPVASMQKAAGMLSAGNAKVPVLDTLNTIGPGTQPSCTTRALELEGAPAGCVRTRGLEYDDAGSQGGGASMSLRTEAADSTIAGVFRFQHAPD